MSAPLIGMPFLSFLILLILSAFTAAIVHWVIGYRFFAGTEGVLRQTDRRLARRVARTCRRRPLVRRGHTLAGLHHPRPDRRVCRRFRRHGLLPGQGEGACAEGNPGNPVRPQRGLIGSQVQLESDPCQLSRRVCP